MTRKNANEKGLANARPFFLGWMMGFEPTTLGTTNRCSNQLSYNHHWDGKYINLEKILA